MIASKFNLVINDRDRDIVYNLIHQKGICLPTGMYGKLLTNTCDTRYLKHFYPFGVEDNDKEEKYKDYLLNSLQYQSSRLNITLMMTMECNFRCTYCFERTSEQEHICEEYIDPEAFCKWIMNIVKRYSIAEVSICFHGGEPTLAVDNIMIIAAKLREFFETNHIFYLFTMVTNGSLLNELIAQKLVRCGIRIVQITIDGDQKTHDARRFMVNGEGSFNTIIHNIRHLPESIKVYLNIVYDHDTCDSVLRLYDYLIENDLNKKIELLVLSHVKPALRDTEIINENQNVKQEAQDSMMLMKEAVKRGYKVPSILSPQVCTIKQKNSFVVHPSGKLYKCISGIGDSHFLIGTIYENEDPFDKQFEVINDIDQECQKCIYSVICNQGCAYETNLIGHKSCQKGYFNHLMPEYIKFVFDPQSEGKENIVYNPEATEWERKYN